MDENSCPDEGTISILDELDRIGYRTVQVSDLGNILAHQSPMMPILAYDEDTGTPKYLNGIRVEDTDGKPVFILFFSEQAKQNNSIWDVQDHDEKVAEQRNKAVAMQQASKDHMGDYR